MAEEKQNVHEGHRERMRKRWEKDGFSGFADHEILEFLLFFSIPRADANTIAHELLKRFGSLAAVLESPCEELMTVQGMGSKSAVLLHMIPGLCGRYLESCTEEGIPMDSVERACEFLKPRFVGKTEEIVLLISLDSKRKLIACDHLYTGTVNAAQISVRKVMEVALRRTATGIILAHNHPGGLALPSGEDIQSTKQIADALRTVRIPLLDHIIYAEGELVSMAESKLL